MVHRFLGVGAGCCVLLFRYHFFIDSYTLFNQMLKILVLTQNPETPLLICLKLVMLWNKFLWFCNEGEEGALVSALCKSIQIIVAVSKVHLIVKVYAMGRAFTSKTIIADRFWSKPHVGRMLPTKNFYQKRFFHRTPPGTSAVLIILWVAFFHFVDRVLGSIPFFLAKLSSFDSQ